ncbi:MAG TPA: acyltransferase family protein [Bacillota bacterium]|nr:acyltransferase family protein [Bacillota bacterium]
MNIDNSEKYNFIDLLKGIGIFLVVWGHTMFPRSVLIYSFHMPLFFFISGFLYKNKPLKDFLRSKIIRLYVPYIVFTILSWTFYLIMLGLQERQDLIDAHLPKIISILNGSGKNGGNDPIWFLTCLIVVSLLFWCLDNLLKKPGLIFAATLGVSGLGYHLGANRIFLPFKADVAFMALIFFYLGHYSREQNWLEQVKKINRNDVIIILIFCTMLHYFLAHLNICLTGIPKVSMISNNLGNYFLFYLTAVLAILVLLIIGYKIGTIHCLNFLGHHSLIILATHKPLLYIFKSILNSHVNTNSRLYGILISIVVIIVTLPLMYLLQSQHSQSNGETYNKA